MKDPICGMEVNENSAFKSSYKGKTYHFCSAACKHAFDKNPDKHSKG
jgi:YHS domain-containing protein